MVLPESKTTNQHNIKNKLLKLARLVVCSDLLLKSGSHTPSLTSSTAAAVNRLVVTSAKSGQIPATRNLPERERIK